MSNRKPTQPTTRHSRRGRTGRERHDVEADVDEGDPQAQTTTDRAEHAATPHQRQAPPSNKTHSTAHIFTNDPHCRKPAHSRRRASTGGRPRRAVTVRGRPPGDARRQPHVRTTSGRPPVETRTASCAPARGGSPSPAHDRRAVPRGQRRTAPGTRPRRRPPRRRTPHAKPPDNNNRMQEGRMSCCQQQAPPPRDAAKMSPRISTSPEPVLAAHVPSPPAAGSHCPARDCSAPHLGNRVKVQPMLLCLREWSGHLVRGHDVAHGHVHGCCL
jgi:hypothetical protein